MKKYLAQKRDEYKIVNGGLGEKSLSTIQSAHIKGLKREKSILGSTIGIEEEDGKSSIHMKTRQAAQQKS